MGLNRLKKDHMLTKKEDVHFSSIKSFDDNDLWRNVKVLMMIHGEMLKT